MIFNDAGEPCGLITNIQGYTIHDGPGIRTELFFKGCTLRCPWCSNPEGIDPLPQHGIYPAKCISLEKCGLCVKNCPAGGSPLVFDENGVIKTVNRTDACRDCFRCVDECPAAALKTWGEKKTVPELMKIIEADRVYYERSGGGVTISGGEALVQWEFARLLFKACKEAGIHTCLESALFVPWEHVQAVLEYTDLLITDIKFYDSERHKKAVGAPNGLILDNIKKAAGTGIPMVIRTPVIPGWNDDEENMLETGRFIKELGPAVKAYQLLPFRKMGTEKYASLGTEYPMETYQTPPLEEREPALIKLRDMLKEKFGLPVTAGASKKLKI